MSQDWVIDASALIQGYIEQQYTSRVQTLLSTLIAPEPNMLHVPEFCLIECTNVLWKQVRRHKTPGR